MRRRWPFLLYAAVAVLHLAQILAGSDAGITKPMLMGSLLLAVLLVAFLTDRAVLDAPHRGLGLGLLVLGIVLSLGGDVLLGPSFLLGLVCFLLAQLSYVAAYAFAVPHRRIAWWSFVYPPWIAALAIVLWPHLDDAMRAPVVAYGIVLALHGMAGARVNRWTTLGAACFVLSDSMLALRLFLPGFTAAFPDPWQDFAIMLTYCLGEGLIAWGMLGALTTARAFATLAAPGAPAAIAADRGGSGESRAS